MSKISNPFGTSASSTASGFGNSLAISPISHVGEPLDLTAIGDSSTQIIFKNLSRKEHENTKMKALEELSAVIEVAPEKELDEGVLSSWMQLYPRLSVDLSRRVRQLTHTVHGTICLTSKKRVARFMPQIIGPWLCGTYDNDRTVSKAARESLVKTFGLEKLKKVWEVYHSDILGYCINIVEREQVYTLSSEAQCKNAEEAEVKFARVIGACISALRHILMDVPLESASKVAESYQEFFGKPRLWEFAYNADPNVRSAVYNLLRACLKKHQGFLDTNLELIAKSVITKSLPISQVGSVSDYLETLKQLTEVYPDIWLLVKGKKTNRAIPLLGQMISQGPQGAQPDFWAKVNRLFDLLPEAVIPEERQGVEDFLDAYVHGINGPTVPRTHALLSWTSFAGVICRFLLLKRLSSDCREMIVDTRILPIYEEYLLQEGKSKFRVTGALATAVCVNVLLKLSPEKNTALSDSTGSSSKANGLNTIFTALWDKLEKILFSRVKSVDNSSEIPPEVFTVGVRWLELLAEFHKLVPDDSSNAEMLGVSYRRVIRICLENLEKHKDNVSLIAKLFESAIALSSPLIWRDAHLLLATEDFFSVQLPNLQSPMASVIFKAMMHWFRFTDSRDTIDVLWTENINALLSSKEENKIETIGSIFRDFPAELRGKVLYVPALGGYVMDKAKKAVNEDDEEAWSFTTSALKVQGALIPEAADVEILELLTQRIMELSPHEVENSSSLLKLEYMAGNHLHSLVTFVGGCPSGSKLLYNLVRLEGLTLDLGDNIVKRINQSIELESQLPESIHDTHFSGLTMAKIITRLVSDYVGHDGVPIPLDFLALKALHSLDQTPAGKKLSIVNALMLPNDEWPILSGEGRPHVKRPFEKPPRPRVDLTNPLSGCVYLIEHNEVSASESNDLSDDYEYQKLLKIAIYTFKLIQEPMFYALLPQNTSVQTFMKLLLIVEVSKDRLPVSSQLGLDRQNFISEVQSFMAVRMKAHHGFFSETGQTDIDLLGLKLLEISRGISPIAFYGARVLYWLLSELTEIHGCSQKVAEDFIEKLGVRNTEDIFLAVSFLLALSQPLTGSKLTDNLRSSLASDVSGISLAQIHNNKAPPKLVLLNSLMPKSNVEDINFPAQRAMFLLRNTLTWFDLDEAETDANTVVNEALISETAKLLKSLIPIVKDVYGSHWRLLCQVILMGWKHSSAMSPMTYWCMKLYEVLKTSYQGNDDFEETIHAYKRQFYLAIIQLFESVEGQTEDPSETICYILLARLVREIPVDEFTSMDRIYPLLRGSKPVQETAYEILQQYIPKQQEQISIEAALATEEDEFTPQVAFELLSLVMETPSPEKLVEIVFCGKVFGELEEASVRGCFLAWRLVFDHFEKATFKVKSAYTANIQEGGYLDKLLDLTFGFIGIARGRSFEPSRDQIQSFPMNEEDWSSEKSVKQLLTHLYYLSLLNTPSLVKAWFMAQTNRQIITGVENFTQKYISPLIIDTELTAVSAWATGELSSSSAPGSSSDIEIQVRVSRAVREVTITCPVDDQVMELLIHLPPTFPLRKPGIEGVKKVGFTELQWKALQLASHAVIAHQGGSIIDAVMLFRKNVSLHFAGVEECAICYSIMGQDRTLPGKKCVTCSNKFHAACLFKWFKTSTSSTCPLCRSSWQFYGRGNH